MKYYSFDQNTGELKSNPLNSSGGYKARLSPADNKKGLKYYLIPKWATGDVSGLEDPPLKTKKNEVAVREGFDPITGRGGKWVIKEDFRGASTYSLDGRPTVVSLIDEKVRPAPNSDLIRPVWDGTDFVEGADVGSIRREYQSQIVSLELRIAKANEKGYFELEAEYITLKESLETKLASL